RFGDLAIGQSRDELFGVPAPPYHSPITIHLSLGVVGRQNGGKRSGFTADFEVSYEIIWDAGYDSSLGFVGIDTRHWSKQLSRGPIFRNAVRKIARPWERHNVATVL